VSFTLPFGAFTVKLKFFTFFLSTSIFTSSIVITCITYSYSSSSESFLKEFISLIISSFNLSDIPSSSCINSHLLVLILSSIFQFVSSILFSFLFFFSLIYLFYFLSYTCILYVNFFYLLIHQFFVNHFHYFQFYSPPLNLYRLLRWQ